MISDKDESEGRKGLNFDIDVPNAREKNCTLYRYIYVTFAY